MQLVTLNTFHPEIRPDLPEVPIPTLNRAIRRAAITLCRRAHVSEHWLPKITLVKGVTTYDTYQSDSVKVIAIPKAKLDGVPLKYPAEYSFDASGNLVLATPPGATKPSALEIKIRTTPEITANEIDAKIIDDFASALRAGALAELYRIPQRDWTDLALSAQWEGIFNSLIHEAKMQVQGENVYNDSVMQYQGYP